LDTREKIKSLNDLRSLVADDQWTALVGVFDPFTADTVETIEHARTPGRKLLVVIRSEPDELLSAESRAILLAGVRSVNAVHVAETEKWRSVVENRSVPIVQEENPRCGRQKFAALVQAKQSASPGA
jgi:hypothetical protein